MCEAFMELIKDRIEVIAEAREEQGEKRGEERGEKRGEERMNLLTLRLADCGRVEDIVKAARDRAYQKQLLEEFGL